MEVSGGPYVQQVTHGNARVCLMSERYEAVVSDGRLEDDTRYCACGCGQSLIQGTKERPSSFRKRRFAGHRHFLNRPNQRNDTIILLAEEGCSHSAICQNLGLTTGTVAGVLNRARDNGLLGEIKATPTRNPFPAPGYCLWPSDHEVQ